jgi:formate dehydrogenase subunit gamma
MTRADRSDLIQRYTLQERVVHWIAGLTYLYLLLTGLAFYTPVLYWIASVFGGGPTIRFWHPWAGLAFVGAVIWMFVKWRQDMTLTDVDRKWANAIGHYIRNEDENLPPAARFNAGQKQFFWIMFFGGLALLVSGIVQWFTDSLPWSLRRVRYLSILVHVTGFLITVAGFIVHVYMGTAVVRGGFGSIVRGEVTRSWAKLHHPLWLAQVTLENRKK